MGYEHTHRTVIIQTIVPKSAGREFFPDDGRTAVDERLADAHDSSRCVVERKSVVDHVILVQTQHLKYSARHVEIPEI